MAEITTIGVVGGGQMRSGIAQLAAVHGFHAGLVDTDWEALVRAKNSIFSSIQRFVSTLQRPAFSGTDAVGRLRCTMKLEDLRFADVVIEAIVESED